ncbi:MAG: hypothetical protein R2817_06905 [Flavobacteriales bacterium]
MVVRFLLRYALFALPALVGIALHVWSYRSSFPAPRLTSNIAVNEQIDRLSAVSTDSVRVLAVGSSMTLNNLASAQVVANLGPAFQNAGAWGIGAAELPLYAAPLLAHFKPAEVLVVTNLMDLAQGSHFTPNDASNVAQHLAEGTGLHAYLLHWNAPYYLVQMRANRIRFTDGANYEHLGYDKYGGSTLEVPSERIDPDRYNAAPVRWDQADRSRMNTFARFADTLHAQGVRLTVLISPYREGLRTTAVEEDATRYVDWLRTVLHHSGQRLVNGYERSWADSLYCDASHFDHEGADAFTHWCMEQLAAQEAITP